MPKPHLTEPKITLKKLSEFGYEKEKNLFLSSPKKGKLTREPLIQKSFHEQIIGKLFGDKGYFSQTLFDNKITFNI